METHSSNLAWKIPWTEEPGWLQFRGSQRVWYNWAHKQAMTNLDNLLKSRDITLLTKFCIVQTMVFSSSHVQMWELDHKEGWTLKNWCFQTVVLEKTLESPLTARRSNQSILKEINPEYLLEGLMLKLKLKLRYSGHLMRRTDSLEKTVMLGKIEGRRRSGWQRMR